MKLVTKIEQVLTNIEELEKSRRRNDEDEAKYKVLVSKGNCFFPYLIEGRISFAPSRFIGYVDNNFLRHQENSTKSGTETNVAINKILEAKPTGSKILEQAYIEFCNSISVIPANKLNRKYWATNDVVGFLEEDIQRSIENDSDIGTTTRQQLVLARVGQGLFREELIKLWGKCVISGCEYVGILRASHIKPWSESNNSERLSVYNGLLLSPNLDALFDKGLISFDGDGSMLISDSLPAAAREKLGCPENARIELLPEHEVFMSWHREKNGFDV